MPLPSWPTIMAAAGGAGLGVGLMWHLVRGQCDRLANEADFIGRAINITKKQATVKELLGDDIEVGRVKFADGWSKMQPLHVQLRVPLRGERDTAFLYAYARRKDDKQMLKLYKLEATFSKIDGKKLVIMDQSNKVDEDDDDDSKVTKKDDERDKGPAKDVSRKKTLEEIKAEMKSWTSR